VLWTAPTKDGEAALNAFHPLAPAKRLRAKPLRKFEGTDLFLRVQQAEKEGLVSWRAGRGGVIVGCGVGCSVWCPSPACTPC